MRRRYNCPHFEIKLCGNEKEVYCRQCNSLIFSEEKTQQIEMKINKLFTKDKKKAKIFLKECAWIHK